MRAWMVAAVLLAASVVHAEPLPPGSLEVLGGGISGAGADAKRLGFGWALGAQASWQPMSTEKRIGYALRWTTLFSRLYTGSAEKVNPPLSVVQMDLTAGIRFRPWTTRKRYLTARGGVTLLRSNDPIGNQRSFVGPVACAGLDQYIGGSIVVGVDVRYGQIAYGPEQLALVLRFGVAGP